MRPFGIPAPVAAIAADLAKLIGAGQALEFDSGMALMGADDSVSETQKVSQILGMEPSPFRERYARYAATLG
jgi:hypothetical protein